MSDAIDTLQSLSALTVLNAKSALQQGIDAILAGQTVFDLRNVKAVDSAAVSVMLAWQRAAHEAGFKLKLENLPPKLKHLTQLYGVCTLVSSELGACAEPVASGAAKEVPAAAAPAALQHH